MSETSPNNSDDFARSLRDPTIRLRRKSMLNAPHMKRLNKYVSQLRQHSKGEVQDFDPLDGGNEALALFLLEKPGPMTANSKLGKREGSGFISRNNDDRTAEATINFMREAKIPRELTIIWNVVPWWNGTRKVSSHELLAGVQCVKELVRLLPKLRTVVFVGQKAAKARPYLETTNLILFSSDHPSPIVRARFPDRWRAIASDWAKVKPVLGLSF